MAGEVVYQDKSSDGGWRVYADGRQERVSPAEMLALRDVRPWDEKLWREEPEPKDAEPEQAEEWKDDRLVSALSEKSGGVPWVKGQSGNPGGRPKALRTAFSAIAEEVTPTEVAGYFAKGIEMAIKTNSAKSLLGYIELYLAYMEGRPVQRIADETDKLDEFILQLRASRRG